MRTFVTEERYWDALECLPPIYISFVDGTKVKSGFVISEPVDSERGLPTFGAFWKDDEGRFVHEPEVTLMKQSGSGIGFHQYNFEEYSKGNLATTVFR